MDVGLKVFYANSDGETVEIPQYYRKAEKRLNRLNRKKSKKFRKGQPQSNNYQKARKRYARKHLRISRQRRGFVEKEALRVIKSNDFIAYEDLNVKGMVKNSKLAKSRTHICPHCGYVEDRDINAAINILKKGLSTVGHTETNTLGERFPLVWLDTSCQIKETQ